MKKNIIIFVAILALFINASFAFAAQKSLEPTEGIKSSDTMSGSFEFSNTQQSPDTFQIQAFTLINGYSCNINNLGNGLVSISGYTQGYSTVKNCQATVYLQKWNGSSWVDLTYVTNSAASNYVSADKQVSVTKGYYYRVRATHYASDGVTTESASSTSSYILVN